MPSWVACDEGHHGGRRREAAIEISQHGSLSPCSQCGKPRFYFVQQRYANTGETHEYVVEKVVRLRQPADVEEEGYDPMIFLMRHRQLGHTCVWPFYWGRDITRKWRVGQFPPLLTLEELKRSVQMLEELK
jgi:hypothetical protein